MSFHSSDVDFFRKHLSSGNFCAGRVKVAVGVCSGDSGKFKPLPPFKLKFKFFSLSGGGMYVENDGLWFLKGITSNTKQNVRAVGDGIYLEFYDRPF